MAQAYFGNTLINQTWLGNTQINEVEVQPWDFILYGGGDIITSQTDFEDRIEPGLTEVTIGSFTIENNNVFVSFDTSAGTRLEFVDNTFTGSNATAVYSTYPFEVPFRMFYQVTSLESIYLVNARPMTLSYPRDINEQAFSGCTGLTSDKITLDPFSYIGQSAFAFCTGLTSAPVGWSCGPFAFNGCTNLNFVNWPNFGTFNDGEFSDVALGQGTGNNNVFQNVASGGTINIPTAFATVASGNPDGDLVYLSGTKGWTINYV